MDKRRRQSSVLIICMLFIFVFFSGAELQDKQEQKKEKGEKPSIFQLAKSLFGTVDTNSAISGRSYREKVKTAINGVQTYLFPPNLDFRGRDEAVDGGEKVKEAAKKSLEKSKATVEESAKLAAEIAGQTMQKTKDKVKKSFPHESEL